MKLINRLVTASVLALSMASITAQAADGNWKKGRIYYRMVCTTCHTDQTGNSIAPSVKTKAEWIAYLSADNHAKGKDTVAYYVSKEYRESIKAKNKAAAKYIKVPDEMLLSDVNAFVQHGAKDSDNPARCN